MLLKEYDFKKVEEGKYDFWVKNHYFESNDKDKRPYAIVIPPPNVTGKLHLGHAWDTTIQDILIRFKRLEGYDAIWIPGMDHAGIATQAKIDAKLKEEGINPRDMEREEWLKVAWKWKDEYSLAIRTQWAKLGLALCYSKEKFTLDETLSKAVKKVFVDLYNEGLIYQGERIINWDPYSMTALSNEEVIYKDVKGAFYYLKYYLKDSDKYLEIATTRPETLFGDTAVAVNPSDERYKDLIGKTVILPLVNKEIPIIGDLHADPEFGTGIVKITPAHDPNDYEVGLRHNLPKVVCLNPNGTMNDNAMEFTGLDRFEARDKIVAKLKKEDLLIKVEEIHHNVGHSERTDVMIEPFLSKQWFVKMRPLADKVLANQKNKDTKVNFVPARYEKIMNHWMEITYDWCISRQLWWGHQIPAWYKNGEVYVGLDAPKEEGWVQDPDVLDTWFSSALWPFSTLGWPSKTDDYLRYYPNNVLVTAYDIIPFWVNRMTFQGLHFTGQRPFKDCLIHGLIRDKNGKKMSKSLGNGIDPMDVCNQYGTDALRYFLVSNTAPGLDLRYDEAKVASSWNYLNKIWNASKYVISKTSDLDRFNLDNLNNEDKWIISKFNKTIKDCTKYMDKYEFNNATNVIYNFFWNDFCDNYIEISKYNQNNLATKSTLLYILTNIIKLMHPFIPFITEEIYQNLPLKTKESIMLETYPLYDKKNNYLEEEKIIDEQIEFIKAFRNYKLENKIDNTYKVFLNNKLDYDLIIKILKLEDHLINNKLDINSYSLLKNKYNILIYYEKEETKEEKEAKEKKINSLKESIKRRKTLLSNEAYLSKAPKELINKEKESLTKEEKELSSLLN